jgi:hypothetical protein
VGFEIPVDLAYFDHPKTLKLIAFTGKSEADIYPLRLWKWAAEYARNGRVDGGAGQIELACKWRGRPGALHKALVDAGFIEKDGVTIHDWMEHIGRAILIYDEKKRKKREKYALEHGLVPEQSREKHPYPGGEGRGGETQDEKPRRGGEKTPPTPPAAAAPGTPDSITDDEIVKAVHHWDPTFPDDQIRTQVTRAVRLGKSKGTLLRDVQNLGASMRIWTIVDGYQYPPKENKNGNGATRENATAYLKSERPAVLQERREEIQNRQDEARLKCDALIENIDPGKMEDWSKEAEAAAAKANIPEGQQRDMFIKGQIRMRVAKEHGIEGI